MLCLNTFQTTLQICLKKRFTINDKPTCPCHFKANIAEVMHWLNLSDTLYIFHVIGQSDFLQTYYIKKCIFVR